MDSITIKDARIIWKNFRGEATEFNQRGDRVFNVVIDHETALELQREDWPVKQFPATEDGEEPNWHMQCKVNYNSQVPPRIFLVKPKQGTRQLLNERTIDILDYQPVAFVDVTLNPYEWNVSGRSGVKPYVKTMYATIDQDELDAQYDDLDEVAVFPSV